MRRLITESVGFQRLLSVTTHLLPAQPAADAVPAGDDRKSQSMEKFTLPNLVKDLLLGGLFPLLLLIAWETLTRLELVPSQLLVPPKQVFSTFVDLMQSGELPTHLKISIIRVLEGFALGATLGFVVGAVLGLSKRAEQYGGPFLKVLLQIPILGWMPFLMLCLGFGELFKIVFISLGAFYPMTLNTYEGIKGVSNEYREVGRVFEFGRFRLLREIIIPSAIPSIFTGIRLGLGTAWMLIVGAELVAATEGVGFMMTMGRQLFQLDVVMVGVIVIGTTGYLMNHILKVAEQRLLHWRTTLHA
jgi:sulfonate transport system permease protein